MHLEAKDLRLIPLDRFFRDHIRVDLEEDVLEGSAKVSAINDGVTGGFRVVEVFAFATEELDGLNVRNVGHAGR